MKKVLVILSVLILIIATFIACSNEEAAADKSENISKEESIEKTDNTNEDNKPVVEENETQSPKELAKEIADLYKSSLTTLSKIIKGNPEPEEIKKDVEKIKEDTIIKMVELGRIREEFDESKKQETNRELMNQLWSVEETEGYEDYLNSINHYNNVDSDLAYELVQFNIITQYAQFELLKKQAPSEAERLGIE
jgi:hypothetical protein